MFVLASALMLLALGAAACAGRNRGGRPPQTTPARPTPTKSFTATAYCQGTMTATGTRVRRGIVAADPTVLPLGSIIQVSGLAGGFNGVYTVADKGPKVRGNTIDIYMSDCRQAVRFGRQRARVSVLQRSS
jgi:3D (Asp-Asp-Asp) domain-containing protein